MPKNNSQCHRKKKSKNSKYCQILWMATLWMHPNRRPLYQQELRSWGRLLHKWIWLLPKCWKHCAAQLKVTYFTLKCDYSWTNCNNEWEDCCEKWWYNLTKNCCTTWDIHGKDKTCPKNWECFAPCIEWGPVCLAVICSTYPVPQSGAPLGGPRPGRTNTLLVHSRIERCINGL